MRFPAGSIVRARGREWVVLPSPPEHKEILLLRPLAGTDRETTGIYLPLIGALERVEPATFPLPDPGQIGDLDSVRLLHQAARLLLRDAAAPFRCIGRLSVRPRAYQVVPLVMALRLNPVRMLIADDVGVGKTIEAALIARELLDRGEIERICVLCPPYLVTQWEQELREKFNIHAEAVTTGTLRRLERGLPRQDMSVFKYYRHLVVSIDFAKQDRRIDDFLLHCPEFVIVDEAHGAAEPPGKNRSQQMRHRLLHRLAQRKDRHIVLLTATPHSGIEQSFRSLLAILDPQYATTSLEQIRERLSRQFIQRRRKDVQTWLGQSTKFPHRKPVERTYRLGRSSEYFELFRDVYNFARGLVVEAERERHRMREWGRRLRYWSALALLRCVMSSPAAAEVALLKRAGAPLDLLESEEGDTEKMDELFSPMVYDREDRDSVSDSSPSAVMEQAELELKEAAARKLRSYAKRARSLRGGKDPKMAEATQIVRDLLGEDRHPIIWCRYVATADYVAAELRRRLSSEFPDLQVASVTGLLSDEERRAKVEELSAAPRRVLVATDCLSEGINLQEHFDSVVHYDLPWNPNRIEQRDGRVDRFGQRKDTVVSVLLYGQDNPIDGAVWNVLIRKAKEIYEDLGIFVPLPLGSESVVESMVRHLFFKRERVDTQLELDLEFSEVLDLHRAWDQAKERQKALFSDPGVRPEELEPLLKETDRVLGGSRDVEAFVISALKRLGVSTMRKDGYWQIDAATLPAAIRDRVQGSFPERIAFDAPAPEGVTVLGRNHPVTSTIAEYVFETALEGDGKGGAGARAGAVRTNAVKRTTTLFLLRARYRMSSEKARELLAEEIAVVGFEGTGTDARKLGEDEALGLLDTARPSGNISSGERRRWVADGLGLWNRFWAEIEASVRDRAARRAAEHSQLRQALAGEAVRVEPLLPPDLLALLVLVPA